MKPTNSCHANLNMIKHSLRIVPAILLLLILANVSASGRDDRKRINEVNNAGFLDITISGTVVDSVDGSPLDGVSVRVKGSKKGTTTDAAGKFTILAQENSVLSFSRVGYTEASVQVGQQLDLTIRLNRVNYNLDQVVVIGYGSNRSRTLTSAVSTINTADLNNPPVATIGQMLQGRMPGVRISQTTGRPGEGIKFQIRGAASLTTSNEPLYVVDGMPIVGDISFIDPNEIESISVLKDPASASLYGSRASNGVVVITTRSGKAGRVQVSFNSYYGIEKVPDGRKLKMMNAREYAQFQKEIDELNNRPVDSVFQNPEKYGEGTDWFDAISRTGAVQGYNLSASGGTDKFKTSATFGYFNEKGVIIGTGFKRYSTRLNTTYTPTGKLTIGLNIAPTYTYNSNAPTDGGPYATQNVVSAALITTPLASPYNPDGTLALTTKDPATFPNPNWLRVLKERVYEDKNLLLLGNAFLEYKVLNGLTAKTSINVQTGNRRIATFNPSTTGVLFIAPPIVPFGSEDNRRFITWVNENILTYQKKIGEHNFELLGGFTSQKFRSDRTFVNATNYNDDRIQAVSAAGTTLVTNEVQEWSLLSALARLNYQYKGKYLFTGSIRRDGSSRFGPNNRWGNFPAISAGWIISSENFWNVSQISFLKLRASYGLTGNFDIGNYTHFSSIGNVYYPFGGASVTGRAPGNLGNPDLGWENNKQLNIGADINLFNDRIQLTYNYYRKITSDLLFNVQVPQSSGFTTIQSNIGELQFWGHEIGLNGSWVKKQDFEWTTNMNISFDRNKTNKITSASGRLFSGLSLYGFSSHITQVGQPIAQFYGGVFDGVYMNQGDFDKSPKFEGSQVGTIKFKDLNGDGKITFPEDMKAIGNPWPKFTFGFANDITYKNFHLSLAFAGSYGNKILAYHENWTTNLDGVFNVLEEVSHRWKSESDPGDGKYGSVLAGTTNIERDRWHSRFLKDGSYLALKNARLAYQFPVQKWFGSNSGISTLQLYISVQNAFIITNYKGPNPEVGGVNFTPGTISPGIDANSYPIPRTYSLGINVNFSK